MRTLTEALAALEDPEAAKKVVQALGQLPPQLQMRFKYTWAINARPSQMMPEQFPWKDDPAAAHFKWHKPSGVVEEVDRRDFQWFVWLILAGRGFGKTRAGAETVRYWRNEAVKRKKPIRIALVGPTAGDARDVMVEGESGILACSPTWEHPTYESSKRRITWPDGSIATLFSAEEPERLRGPQHHVGWADELAAWADAKAVWDMMMFGMRLVRTVTLGPQVCVTTTPKPVPGLVGIFRDQKTYITTGSTFDNRANLAPTFFDAVISNYDGTRLGRQEVAGELLLDVQGALWSSSVIDNHRLNPGDFDPNKLLRVVVAVDPSISEAENAEAGIVVAGINKLGHVYVLEDGSLQGKPIEWARRAMALWHKHKADKLIGEANNGGAMVETTLMMAAGVEQFGFYNYRAVHASKGKLTRAEPVSAMYEKGLVHHVGQFKQLEDQMINYSPAQAGKMLADRMDALVWAVTELAVKDIQMATSRNMFTGKKK